MNIAINTAGMSNPAAMEYWTERAAWLWDLRTNKDFVYTGPTSSTTPGAGETLLLMPTATVWASLGGSASSPNAFTQDSGSGQIIYFNPYIAITGAHDELIKHEMGHAAGYFTLYGGFHSNDPDDIMYPSVGIGNFPIDTADAQGVNNFSPLPTTDTADLHSTYLRDDLDMFVPELLVAGTPYQAQLDYQGVVNLGAGSKPTHLLHSYAVNEEATGASPDYVSGSTVYLNRLEAFTGQQDYANAQFSVVIVGSSIFLQLDSWTPA